MWSKISTLSLAAACFLAPSPAAAAFDTQLPQNKLQNSSTTSSQRPNFVFIITDDQDLQLGSLDYMPLVAKHFREQGTYFSNHFCTVSLCCPSRVSLLTGRAAHNTNVTDVTPPYGGYTKFVSQGLNEDYLPVWLQGQGYNTYYTGKLMNGHSITDYNSPFAAGFNGSDFLLEPNTYQYYNATFQRDHDAPITYPGEYSTDLVAARALGYVDEASTALNSSGKPFFLGIAPIGPHAVTTWLNGNTSAGAVFTAPQAAARHENLFPNVTVPRTANFNPEEPSGASWIKNLPRLNESNIASNDDWYRKRLQALQAVDELVDDVINRLDTLGLLENTYVFYTSDNGFHISQHRLQPGKTCGIEEDIRVPLFMRGPGIEANKSVELVTTHTDIVPTIYGLAGLNLHSNFDGAAFPLTGLIAQDKDVRHEHVNVEYWGTGLDEGPYAQARHVNNTYKTVRVLGQGYDLSYTVWCTNEHELYDISADPYQLTNLYPTTASDATITYTNTTTTLLNTTISAVTSRLDALLMILKSCTATACTKPWQVLHPLGNVNDLKDALNSTYDAFYEEQADRVEFSECALGHIIAAEGPQSAYVWREGTSWSDWT